MRVATSILALLIALGLAVPWGATPTGAAQDPTPTPTSTATVTATAALTSTTTPTTTPTATAGNGLITPTATTAPGSATIVSVGPNPSNTNEIVITGNGFLNGATALIDGQPIQVVAVAGPTSLTATLPNGLAAGPHSIVVINPNFPPSPPFSAPLFFAAETVLHVPVAVKRPPIDSTAIFVQNISQTFTTVNVQFFDLSGTTQPQWNRTAGVGPGESTLFDLATDPNVPPGFDGSAVVRADQRITGVVNHIMSGQLGPGVSPDASSPQAHTSAGSFAIGASVPATQASVPVAFGGYHGYFTTISVQNAGPAQGTFTVALFPTGLASPIASIPRTIAPNASARVRLGPEVGIAPDFVGSVMVTSQGAPLVVAAETFHVETGTMLSYSGFPAGTNVVNVPLLFKNYNGWISGAQVVNVGTSPVLVNPVIIQRDGPIGTRLPPRSLAPNESMNVYLPAIPDLPDDFVGSGVFTANGPISVVVQEINAERGSGMAYTGFGAGTPNISVPVIFKDSAGWDTGIQVQNLGQVDAFVNALYHLPGGMTVPESALIASGSSTTFYQPDHPGIPSGAIGAATITSATGQPIVAIVNEVNYDRAGDASMAYEGINY